MKEMLKWIIGYIVFAVMIIAIFNTFVRPALCVTSAIVHFYWPILIIGFLFTITRKCFTNHWA